MTGVRLILFAARGIPCELDPDRPTHTRCGLHVSRGREITEAQALVYLNDVRCSRCVPQRERATARRLEAAKRGVR